MRDTGDLFFLSLASFFFFIIITSMIMVEPSIVYTTSFTICFYTFPVNYLICKIDTYNLFGWRLSIDVTKGCDAIVKCVYFKTSRKCQVGNFFVYRLPQSIYDGGSRWRENTSFHLNLILSMIGCDYWTQIKCTEYDIVEDIFPTDKYRIKWSFENLKIHYWSKFFKK